MKRNLFLLALLVIVNLSAQTIQTYFDEVDVFFKAHVKNGKVDYDAIKKDDSKLKNLIAYAENIRVDISDKKNYKAFWINSYNLLTIKGIVKNYPIKSPLDVKGFFDTISYTIGGESLTLNDIENKKLRANFKDPRIHFVLVCGAIGCPPIINKAYLPNTLETLLTQQTKAAINSNFVEINHKKKTVYVSQIMEWYREDFILDGDEISFLNKYLEKPIHQKFKLKYFEYNWKLNKQ